MNMAEKISEDIYSIPIRLVGNPLKQLNCYVVKTQQRNLIIDTGFNQQECLEDLMNGINELRLNMEKTDIFLTHFHADHTGLVTKIAAKGSKIYISAADKKMFDVFIDESGKHWQLFEDMFIKAGYPAKELALAAKTNPARALAAKDNFNCTQLNDGDVLKVGGHNFTCVLTPGHTPGHMCLYEKATETMFLGDHVLFDITPNITAWPSLPNALSCYLKSLNKMKSFEINLPLPAHRSNAGLVKERVQALEKHHEKRLEDTFAIVCENAGICGYDVASKMKWSIRAKNWQEFPSAQKWFAVGETLAHLNYLVDENKIKCQFQGGVYRYRV